MKRHLSLAFIFLVVLGHAVSGQEYNEIPLPQYYGSFYIAKTSPEEQADAVYFSEGFSVKINYAEFVEITKSYPVDGFDETLVPEKKHSAYRQYLVADSSLLSGLPLKDTFMFTCRTKPSYTYSAAPRYDSVNQLFTYTYDSMLSNASIEWSLGRDKNANGETIFYFPPGYYSGWTEVDALILLVQIRLNELGYDCPKNNRMSTQTRGAIIKYQKEHVVLAHTTAEMQFTDMKIDGYFDSWYVDE